MVQQKIEKEQNNILSGNDIFKKETTSVITLPKEYAVFTTVLQLFYKKRLSDINIDIFEDTDIMLVTGRNGYDFHKFLFISNKNEYSKDEKELVEYFKKLNYKIVKIDFTPYELMTFLFKGLVDLYKKFKDKAKQNNDLEQLTKTFYEFLAERNLNDTGLYIVEGTIISNKNFIEVEINKNNRVNIFYSSRKIKEGLIKKIFGLVLRPNYTDLRFEDVRNSMLDVFKVERLIFDFLSGGWIDVIKREKPDLYVELENNEEKKKEFGRKILDDFFVVLDVLSIRISDEQMELLRKSQLATEEEKEEIFKKIDFYGSTLKKKDDINKFFTALSSGAALLLVTGPTGSGKTTFLMTGLQELIRKVPRTVITLEDPVEFMLVNDLGLVYQREIKKDVSNYLVGVKDALREKPHIIALGEIRESEEENLAKQLIEAAKTGHLVTGTLHGKSLYDGYNRFKELAKTEETFLNYIINLRRIKLLNGEYMTVYSHYIYDKTKDSSTSIKEMIEVDKSLYGSTSKLLMLFLTGYIDIHTLSANAADNNYLSKEMDKIKNTNYVDLIFSRETLIGIEEIAGVSE